jgi:ABC-type multidrug transport system fused ATPase/permease subunit
MSYILTQIQSAESGSKEYFEILDLKSAENYLDDGNVEPAKSPEIEFKDVSFSYEKGETVFKDVSFTINDKDTLALVGPSGAGKTTIVNLLLKFYEPNSGKILFNGKDYKDLTHNYIRKNIALVFQENELFSSTVLENVAYGSAGATAGGKGGKFPDEAKVDEAKVIDALKKANAWEFVSKYKEGLYTEVGERGIKLSGGQKQRIQIARAIYKDAPILILDEATSSLDSKSESEVSQALEALFKDRMVIIIAHRFSTIQNATRIIVLNDKRIEATGTPLELANQKGIYSELLQYQIEGNKKLLQKFEIY